MMNFQNLFSKKCAHVIKALAKYTYLAFRRRDEFLMQQRNIVPVQCHRHGRTNRWGTLLRGRARHRCDLSSMAATVVRSWSGFCVFHPWISGFWVGCSGLAGWVGCRDGGSGEGRCAACPIIAYTISGSPLRVMCAMSSSLTHRPEQDDHFVCDILQ